MTTPSSRSRFAESSRRISRVCAAITIAVGALVLAGWAFDVALMTRLSPHATPMAPNAACAFVLLGMALWLLSARDPPPRIRAVAATLGIVLASLGTLTLLEYTTGRSLGIDQFVFGDPRGAVKTAAPGRMAPAAALNFLLLGVAVALLAARRAQQTAQALCHCVSGIALVAFAGYLYDVQALYAMGSFTGIAFHTVLAFLVAGIGLVAADPDHGVTALLTSGTIGGVIVRRILPFAIGIPIVLGWLERKGRRAGLYQGDLGVALLVVATIVFVGIVIGRQGAALARIDRERSKATGEVSQAAETLRTLSRAVEQSPASVIITDPDGNIEYVNPKFTQLTGYASDEVLGMNPRILKSGELPPEVYRELWETITAGGEWRGEFHNRKKNGDYFWEFASISPIYDERRRITHFVAVKEDITDRKRAEEALLESERQFRAVFDGAMDGMTILDDAGRFLEVNAAATRLYGRPPSELVGSRIGAFSNIDVEVVWPQFLTSGRARGESQLSCPDGTTREIEFVATANFLPGRHLSILHDITERKRAEDTLSRRERHFRSLIENAQDIITIIDLEGTIRFQSPAAERILGRPPAEFVGKNAFDFIHPDDGPEALAAIRHAIASPQSPKTWTFRFSHANGSWRTVEAIGKMLPGEVPPQVVVNSRDMTESRAVEDQLRQSQKMEAVGRLAGGIAHDFNNLLTVITGYAEMSASRVKPEDPSRVEIDEIQKAARRAADLTRQLLAFSRKQVLQPRVIDLNRVISETEKMLRRVIGEDVRLVTLPTEPLGPVKADTGQIEQVLLNLAVNARDAMPRGGTLTIETSEVELDEGYSAFRFDVPPGRYVLLAVSDNGSGMNAKTLSHIFEPFFTTKEPGKGTGLGLSTVYGVVKQSGGHVTVYSEPGMGTTFKIYLPRVDDLPERDRRPPAQTHAAGGTETLLVVEDEDAVRRMSCRALEAQGYRVLAAAGADEALHLCETHGAEIHLMLTDVVMPHQSGKDLARRATALRPAMKVLFMSGYTDDAIVHHGVLDAGTPFLPKPFTPRSLAQKVREVLDAGESTGE